jgi:anhydro-N-acetylmuramic acid kinase
MISGTSFDAVEAVIADLELVTDGAAPAVGCELLEHRSIPYPDDVRAAIAALLPPAPTTIEAVCRLDIAVGHHFGEVAAALAGDHGGVAAVCSHGQTVYHLVEANHALGTLQLGEPAWIAERTGATVVSDVRNRDIAAGGHGAPLASLLDVMLLDPDVPSGSLNLGGISNVTLVRPGREPVAFDIGPANALLDAAVQWRSGGRSHYDAGGKLAAAGKVDTDLFARLLDDPYFALAPPKSTGKELFHLGYLTDRLGDRPISDEDLLATLTASAAESVAAALRREQLSVCYVAGGGTRNPVLMAEISARLPEVDIRRFDELGVAEHAKEALVFALIGFLTLHGLPATIPSCTGADRPSVLGSVTPGPRGLPASLLAGPAARPAGAPGRLIVRRSLP